MNSWILAVSERLLLRWILFTVVFFGAPLGLLYHITQLSNEAEYIQARQAPIHQLKSAIQEAKRYADPDFFLRRVFIDIERLINSSPEKRQLREVHRTLTRLHFHLRGVAEYLFLDDRGRPLHRLSHLRVPAATTAAFLRDFRALVRHDQMNMKKRLPRYRTIFGSLFGRNPKLKLTRQITPASFRDRRNRVYLSGELRSDTIGAFLVFFSNTPNYDQRLLSAKAGFLQRRFPALRIAFADLQEERWYTEFPHLFTKTAQGRLLTRLGEQEGKMLPLGRYVWTQLSFSPTQRMYLAAPNPGRERFLLQQTRARLFFGGLFAVFSLFSLALFRGGRVSEATPDTAPATALPLRRQLVLLFLYMVGMPLVLLFLTHHGYARERRATLENQLYDIQEKLLREYDRGLQKQIGLIDRELRRRLSAAIPAGQTHEEVIIKRLRAIETDLNPNICEWLTAKGIQVFRSHRRHDSSAKRFLAFVKNAIKAILHEINKETGKAAGAGNAAQDHFISMTAEFIGMNPDLLLSMFTQHMGQLQEYTLANQCYLTYFFPLRDRTGEAKSISLVAWQKGRLAGEYTQRPRHIMLPRFLRTTLQGLSVRNTPDELDGPTSFPLLEQILPEVTNNPLPQRYRLVQGGKVYFVTAMNGVQLFEQRLVARTSNEGIEREISAFVSRFLALSLMVLVISFSMGHLLLKSVIAPIQHLETGLHALQIRDFRSRIPNMNQDEFGDLGKAFNGLLENLEDLEIARVVQDTFFPAEPLSINGWEIFGGCRPASRVGGDYFDYFAVGPDQIGFIIGDVSGHGVPAALVVAMAKALIAHPANEFVPVKILEVMQYVFSTTLKRKKLMSCQIGLLETTTGRVTIANAGHCYPYHIFPQQAVSVTIRGTLLGIKATLKNFETVTLDLAPDSRLLMYTDGIIEAQTLGGEMIGFDRLEKALPGLRGATAMASERNVRLWMEELAGEGPFDDDITLLFLQPGPGQTD
jgi:HAMP domain-containing protein